MHPCRKLTHDDPERYTTGTTILGVDNDLRMRDGEVPSPGDAVILGLDHRGRVAVLGFPGLRPVPERIARETWENDPLREWMATRPADFLRCCGGALPVTVEQCIPER